MNFNEVEKEVTRLRQELAAGRLTDEQFKDRLKELMVQDAQGTWWMVGAETGGWYRHDGTDWVQADPSGRVALRAAPQPVARPVAPVKPKPRRFWGIVVLVLGLAVTLVAGGTAWDPAHDVVDETMAWVCTGAIWLGGLILTIIITRKVWRRK